MKQAGCHLKPEYTRLPARKTGLVNIFVMAELNLIRIRLGGLRAHNIRLPQALTGTYLAVIAHCYTIM